MIREINWGLLGALVFCVAAWAAIFIGIGLVARSAKFLFCIGYGC